MWVWAGECVGRSMTERMLSGGEINEEMVSDKERKEKRKEASRVTFDRTSNTVIYVLSRSMNGY